MCMSSPSIPSTPVVEAPQAPTTVDAAVQEARTSAKKQAALAAGRQSTFGSSGALGDTSAAPTAKATLLGA